MKILMTIFAIQDYGGIVPHVEHLAMGLKELGHTVEFVMLMHQPNRPRAQYPVSEDGWFTLGTGYPFHPSKGWTGMPRFGWQSPAERQRFKDFCSNFDGVIWHIPVPTTNNATAGQMGWTELYLKEIPHLAVVHDGNLPRLYPHILTVRDSFKKLICVHDSAYYSSMDTGMSRELVVNPFDVEGWASYPAPKFEARRGVVAVQVFKAWKHVDSLIRAIPHLKSGKDVIVGGGGIEQRYMTSEEKCKPAYINADGSRIWNRALEAGMKYVGYVPNDQVYDYLLNARVQIDTSYSRKYAKFGSHFNRTTVEAMLCGAVPMATDLGMKGATLFKAGANYVEFPSTATPQELAGLIESTCKDRKQWEYITESNRGMLINNFDRRAVAAKFVNALVEKAPFHGPATPELVTACNEQMKFFNGGAEC